MRRRREGGAREAAEQRGEGVHRSVCACLVSGSIRAYGRRVGGARKEKSSRGMRALESLRSKCALALRGKKKEKNQTLQKRRKKQKQDQEEIAPPPLSPSRILLLFLSSTVSFLGALAPAVEPLRALGEHVEDRLPVFEIF